jgi:hypothetical protein
VFDFLGEREFCKFARFRIEKDDEGYSCDSAQREIDVKACAMSEKAN